MTRNTVKAGNGDGKTYVSSSIDESTLYLTVLMVSAGFFALLMYAASAGTSFGIDATASASLETTSIVKTRFEKEVTKMVAGNPIEEMVPYIARQDPETAKYLVSIAKHESNWGRFSPKDAAGKTCYNYWGYRGSGDNVTASGYSCFGSPKEAVAVVGSRLDYLVNGLSLNTPKELIVWKCGRSCVGHSKGDVARWIGNVDLYSRKIERVAGIEDSR
jgi:hypothetical protein